MSDNEDMQTGFSDNQGAGRERKDFRGGEGDKMRGGKNKFFFKKKVCRACHSNTPLNYKDVETIRRYMTDSGKILPRRITGTCAKHQRKLTTEIKRARTMAFVPYVKN